jgi:SAM-dependent methyltransferase
MSMQQREYFFDQAADQERARLGGLSALFDPITIRHLTAAGVGPGWACLEVGAGAGSIAAWLSAAVGPTGRVTATDLDVRLLDGLGDRIEVVQHDVTRDPLEQDAYDLVHARALLEHLPQRDEIVGTLASAVRPEGLLVLEDFVFGGPASAMLAAATEPASDGPIMTKALDAIAAGFRAIGADPEFGLRLPAAMTAAGLRDVDAELTFRLVSGGSPESAFYTQTLTERADRLVEVGLLSRADGDAAIALGADRSSRYFALGVVTARGRR